jgi:hypothetical protein
METGKIIEVIEDEPAPIKVPYLVPPSRQPKVVPQKVEESEYVPVRRK